MKYEKAVAVVVEFDNSDVVTESVGDQFSCDLPSVLVDGGPCAAPVLSEHCGQTFTFQVACPSFAML